MRSEAHEQAADAAADRVTRTSAGATDLSRVRSGSPLDPATRAFMETRFEHDFSRVRVHNDDKAAESARSLNALAYTSRNDIVLGREALALDSAGGRRLLAHELAHVVQQSSGVAEGIQRKPLFPVGRTNYRFDTAQITADDLDDPEIKMRLQSMSRPQLRAYRDRVADGVVQGYISSLMTAPPLATVEEKPIEFTQANMEANKKAGYWFPRTNAVYDVTPASFTRLAKNAEEHDAVFAAVWGLWPEGPPSGSAKENVTIPPSAQRKNALLYELTVNPPAAAGGKPVLETRFLSERAGNVLQPAPEPSRGYVATKLEISTAMGFPGDESRWLKDHPDENRQIGFWLDRQNGSFEGVLLTRSLPKSGKGPPRETMFLLKGKKEKGKPIADLHIELLDDRRPTAVTPPDDYRGRDFADTMIHDAQTKPHDKLGDKLGHVELSGVPASEVFSVKFAVASYWKQGTRSAEVDALLPMAGSARQVYYTLRFRSDLEVDVERVGEKGSSAKLDPQSLDVARAHGYDDNSSDPAKLKSWLGKRYPGVKPKGTTVDELRESANQAMKAGAGAEAWYADNYKIVVMGGAAAKARLKSVHGLKEPQVPDTEMKSFTADELKFAELSLQTLTDRILPLMKSLHLGRQVLARKPDGSEKKTAGGRTVGAQTFPAGAKRMIVVYDAGMKDDGFGKAAFHGGAEGVHDTRVPLLTHEIGHSLEPSLGTTKAFNKFVKREGIQPFTSYAAEDPGEEFFAEAFARYQTDPEWLRRNHYQVYAWLDELNKTGKVPK